MKHALLIVLCLALLLGLFAAILDRHEALQKARLERLFPAMSSVRYHNGCCILRVSAMPRGSFCTGYLAHMSGLSHRRRKARRRKSAGFLIVFTCPARRAP